MWQKLFLWIHYPWSWCGKERPSKKIRNVVWPQNCCIKQSVPHSTCFEASTQHIFTLNPSNSIFHPHLSSFFCPIYFNWTRNKPQIMQHCLDRVAKISKQLDILQQYGHFAWSIVHTTWLAEWDLTRTCLAFVSFSGLIINPIL